MNLQLLKQEFDADLASLDDAELISELERAGFVFSEPWLDCVLEVETLSTGPSKPAISIADSNELALAA